MSINCFGCKYFGSACLVIHLPFDPFPCDLVTYKKPIMVFYLLVFIFPAIHAQNHPPLFNTPENVSTICEITGPIDEWLKNNTGSCDVVKGHFILNEAANKYARQIFSTFSGLKRIEGCIYVRKYTGSRNLYFFSNLEEVICDENEGKPPFVHSQFLTFSFFCLCLIRFKRSSPV